MRHPADEGEDWTEIFGKTFSHSELREAADFGDVVRSYGFVESMLSTFIREKMKVGHRLFLIQNLKPSELGVMAMREPDDRLAHIIRERCSEMHRQEEGRQCIVLPSE